MIDNFKRNIPNNLLHLNGQIDNLEKKIDQWTYQIWMDKFVNNIMILFICNK